eukprot:TRINITY_DN2358_c0_g2_i3.p1 TRINITY_DN2358_c0_g2~~TRINITY_DN2358_c0_g2_i3.p1  ORF type:complete len:1152 (+),score=285.86 TRINITY_DN2358_c0_g2_i3:469-3924(+)
MGIPLLLLSRKRDLLLKQLRRSVGCSSQAFEVGEIGGDMTYMGCVWIEWMRGVEGVLQSGKRKGRVEDAHGDTPASSESEEGLTPEAIEKKRRLLLTSIRSGRDRWRYDLHGVRMDRVDGLLKGDPGVWEKQEYDGMYFHPSKDGWSVAEGMAEDDGGGESDSAGDVGRDDDIPGYTVAEVCLFARSVVLSQQALGLRVLLGVISHGGTEEIGMCMEHHLHRIIQIGLRSKGLIVNSLSLQVMESIVRKAIQLSGLRSQSWKSLFVASSESEENDIISDSRLDGTISGFGQDASSLWSVGVLRRLKSNKKESDPSLLDDEDGILSEHRVETLVRKGESDEDSMDWKINICSVFQKIGILSELELVINRFPSLSQQALEVVALLLPESSSFASQILHSKTLFPFLSSHLEKGHNFDDGSVSEEALRTRALCVHILTLASSHGRNICRRILHSCLDLPRVVTLLVFDDVQRFLTHFGIRDGEKDVETQRHFQHARRSKEIRVFRCALLDFWRVVTSYGLDESDEWIKSYPILNALRIIHEGQDVCGCVFSLLGSTLNSDVSKMLDGPAGPKTWGDEPECEMIERVWEFAHKEWENVLMGEKEEFNPVKISGLMCLWRSVLQSVSRLHVIAPTIHLFSSWKESALHWLSLDSTRIENLFSFIQSKNALPRCLEDACQLIWLTCRIGKDEIPQSTLRLLREFVGLTLRHVRDVFGSVVHICDGECVRHWSLARSAFFCVQCVRMWRIGNDEVDRTDCTDADENDDQTTLDHLNKLAFETSLHLCQFLLPLDAFASLYLVKEVVFNAEDMFGKGDGFDGFSTAFRTEVVEYFSKWFGKDVLFASRSLWDAHCLNIQSYHRFSGMSSLPLSSHSFADAFVSSWNPAWLKFWSEKLYSKAKNWTEKHGVFMHFALMRALVKCSKGEMHYGLEMARNVDAFLDVMDSIFPTNSYRMMMSNVAESHAVFDDVLDCFLESGGMDGLHFDRILGMFLDPRVNDSYYRLKIYTQCERMLQILKIPRWYFSDVMRDDQKAGDDGTVVNVVEKDMRVMHQIMHCVSLEPDLKDANFTFFRSLLHQIASYKFSLCRGSDGKSSEDTNPVESSFVVEFAVVAPDSVWTEWIAVLKAGVDDNLIHKIVMNALKTPTLSDKCRHRLNSL